MRRLLLVFSSSFLCSMFFAPYVVAEDEPASKKIVSLADFGAKLDSLEQAVDDIAFSAALALLTQEYPNWEFTRSSGFDGVNSDISDDLGAIAGDHDYAMGKLRGAIFRNGYVSEDQKQRALEIYKGVKEFISAGYDLEGMIDRGDMAKAGAFYKESLLEDAAKLNEDIENLTEEIDQVIKLSAI